MKSSSAANSVTEQITEINLYVATTCALPEEENFATVEAALEGNPYTVVYGHVTLVTVSESGVDIANLRLSGIFDKSGKIPAGGEGLCFEAAVCGEH
ncbi:MAG: hypothetical protein HKN57_10395 [Xanthomonadales bacterium]|nr:hypothetical protein [Gammaproteobacteria bacterium]MBT8052900.1 hypothetical protein [Gammaproteobacteria bacterium]NND57655.1 hypothetical protein [Xanthomonadales bacterium]NNK51571.1 hypothetical protein [Xanthomonadales bacterium]